MQRSFLAIAAATVVTVLAACTADQGVPRRGPAAAAAERCEPGLDKAFGAWAEAGFSGSIAISKAGRFECLAAYGSADDAAGRANTPETVFSIGSITKAFTAAAVLRLLDEGKLSLDDRAGKVLPELDGPVAKATIRQLLLHTSGLNGSHGRDYEPLDRDSAVAAIGRLTLAFAPGSGYVYSNAGYTLLALIVEKASGTSYRKYVAENLLRLPGRRVAGGFWSGEPAARGPRAVGYHDDGRTGERGDFRGPYWGMEGNGGLAMTTADLASWAHALFTGGLVSRRAAELIAGPGHDLGGGRAETPGWVAFDSSVYGEPFLSTAGGGGEVGHNAVVVWVPGQRRVIAVASNKARVSAEELLQAVGPALLAGRPVPVPDAPAGAGDGDLASATGSYELETGGSYQVSAKEGELTITARGADAVTALFPPRGEVDLREHERRVLALLDGRTQEGREERANLQKAFGAFTGVALAGSVVDDGEVRTYVTISTERRPVTAWYAVNEHGGIHAAELRPEPPRLTLVPDGGGRYRPDDPAGTGPEVSVAFRDRRMSITRSGRHGGTSVARATG
ncbi:hypothetical protein GCM10010412_080020 [Nonomuraea recticatena]|uniref:Beta-lactamase-related domain-containing protein n=1 Tax=Nonomuraea recticatena TaxID=46178 RepID=A0ABN3T3G4_9ACTN